MTLPASDGPEAGSGVSVPWSYSPSAASSVAAGSLGRGV